MDTLVEERSRSGMIEGCLMDGSLHRCLDKWTNTCIEQKRMDGWMDGWLEHNWINQWMIME